MDEVAKFCRKTTNQHDTQIKLLAGKIPPIFLHTYLKTEVFRPQLRKFFPPLEKS